MQEIILRVCLWATVPLAGFYGLLFWKLEIWPKMRRKRMKKKAGAYAARQKRQNIYR